MACPPKEKRIVEVKSTEVFKNVEGGLVPAYTIQAENWSINIVDCHTADSTTPLGTTTTETIYVKDGTEQPKETHVVSTKTYNITIRFVNDNNHCHLADAPCWPREKRYIDIKAIE